MVSKILAFLALASLSMGADWVLPAANQGNWVPGTNVGVTGGINQYRVGGASARTNLIDVSAAPYNADTSGLTSSSAAIIAAKDAAGANDVIYFPAGIYKLTYSIPIYAADSNKTFRGAAGDVSIIYGSFGNACFSFQGGGGPYGSNITTVSGTKTKGTSNLTVGSSTGYTVGTLATVYVENETDSARISSTGAAPTWDNSGFADKRGVLCRVTAIPDGTHLTVDPPLPWDCTAYATRVEMSSNDGKINRVGFEDLVFTFDAANHPSDAISFDHAFECWAYNIKAPEWKKNGGANDVIKIDASHRVEVRRCDFRTLAPTSYSDDGAVQLASSSSSLIEDNIMVGFDSGIYDSGKTYNNAILYNYMIGQDGNYPGHNGHNSLSLFEGNVVNNFHLDSYHGSGSHQTFYRNWMQRGIFIRRFMYYMVTTGNIYGWDGQIDEGNSFGLPNIGNESYSGEANHFTGDPHNHWNATGTVTTRTNGIDGVVTVDPGVLLTAGNYDGGAVSIRWPGGHRPQMGMVSRTGQALTVGIGPAGDQGDPLPTAGTAVSVWFFNGGYQELDNGVDFTLTRVKNYHGTAVGTGAIEDDTSETLPNSLAYAAQPSWWTADSFAGAWPPVNPAAPNFSESIIPAGFRFTNVAPPDPPTPVPPTSPQIRGWNKGKARRALVH